MELQKDKSKVIVEDGEVKTILSEEIEKDGWMSIEEAERLTLEIIDKEYELP